ncbi:MAG: hypothetical protein ACHQ1F_11925, partial [Spirochaetia bacterium]
MIIRNATILDFLTLPCRRLGGSLPRFGRLRFGAIRVRDSEHFRRDFVGDLTRRIDREEQTVILRNDDAQTAGGSHFAQHRFSLLTELVDEFLA